MKVFIEDTTVVPPEIIEAFSQAHLKEQLDCAWDVWHILEWDEWEWPNASDPGWCWLRCPVHRLTIAWQPSMQKIDASLP